MILNNKEIKVIRENANITDADKQYCEALKYILENGQQTNNRTGIDTISVAGMNFKFDLSKEFPILETKKVVIRNAASEIMWIHIVQSNIVKWLNDRDNHVWDEWMVDDDGIYRLYEQGENAIYDPEKKVPLVYRSLNKTTGIIEEFPYKDKSNKIVMVKSKDLMDNKSNPRTIKKAILFGKKWSGTIGDAYGSINSQTLAPQRVEYTLKHNPTDRRMIISLWQDEHLINAVLPSCVWSSEFKVTPDGKLNMYVHQRSADIPLGLPFNWSQYALLQHMYAKACNLEVGTLNWSIMDAHIYVNQIPGIQKQLKRYQYMNEYSTVIKNLPDNSLQNLYNKIIDHYNLLYLKAKLLIKEDIENLKQSEIISKLKLINTNIADEYEEAYERKVSFEHMITRETPIIELANHDSIFNYSTEFVKKDDKYLNENPIGNKEMVLKKYHHAPFISMPITQ